MHLSEILNAAGLALDIVGFSILFGLAIPALMRRNFVTSDRVGIDGVEWMRAKPNASCIPRARNGRSGDNANDKLCATGLAVRQS